MLTQYLLHNNKTLFYIDYTLYRLDKTKIAFENHYSINVKLFKPTFYYPKFHTMIHFIWCIWGYGSAINYDIVHSETAYKYLLKAFYGRINKKKYKSQILEHNIHYNNVIAIQDALLIAKLSVKNAKIKEFVIDTPDVKVMQVCSATNVWLKYNCHLDPTGYKAAINLGLQSVKKYWRRIAQIVDKLSHLSDFFLAFAVFLNKIHGNYN